MKKLVVYGRHRVSGELPMYGAKNSALPILCAALLNTGESVLHNCPKLSDVSNACNILSYLGCNVKREDSIITVSAGQVIKNDIPAELMSEMRSSILFLGAILAKTGSATVNFPGGCEIGQRPIDLHLSAFRKMGVQIDEEHGFLKCKVLDCLKGAPIYLSFPSVGATENIMISACLAHGKTTIYNAAAEPEIVDLANYLIACGAKIRGAGDNTIYIEGVNALHSAEHHIIPDRIVTATFLAACGITGGEILLRNVCKEHLTGILPLLEEAGCRMVCSENSIYMKAPERLKSFELIRTMPYPGFPTDVQPIFMSMASVAEGTSLFIENIFENRYQHVGELIKMGAKINLEGKAAIVDGVSKLSGAAVKATDLRGGAALLIAGLAAQGRTILQNIYHIKRGYEDMPCAFTALGCKVKEIEEK